MNWQPFEQAKNGDDLPLTVRERLRLIRLYSGMTVEYLEEVSELNAQRILDLEAGNHGWSSRDILQYANYCHCLFDFLTGQLPNQREADDRLIVCCREKGIAV